MNDKDRLGRLLQQKERAEEDRYFAERDRKLIAALKQQQEAEHEKTIRELARSRCPRCGERLSQHAFHGVMVDECPACEGMWLDRGEIQAVLQQQGSDWMSKFLKGLANLLTHPRG
jgi:DNA repair exonuclease SbcCD ATPase subunit